MAVAAKNWPENVGHGEVDTHISNVRERGPLLPLPQYGGAVAATGAGPRFAGVRENLLLGLGRIHLRS